MQDKSGFTLIEISIVLVVIGLVIGGILVGSNMIDAAYTRAQMTQIEKYNTAVNAFQTKYGYLPGDIPDPDASKAGFLPRGSFPGEGDGDGILQGNNNNSNTNHDGNQTCCGELALFWVDLTIANLTDVHVNTSGAAGYPNANVVSYNHFLNTTPGVKDYIPPAKLGQNNFVYAMSLYNNNYFTVSSVTMMSGTISSTADPGLTVQQAYNIDTKIDDGLPQSGNVIACYINYNINNWKTIWAAGGQIEGTSGGTDNGNNNNNTNHCVATTTATVTAGTDCFGNNNTAGTMTYSIVNNGNLKNCALSFQFQ